MSAAEEVAGAWREDMDRLHAANAHLQELLERAVYAAEKLRSQRDDAIEVIVRIRAWDQIASGQSGDEPFWRREIDAWLQRITDYE